MKKRLAVIGLAALAAFGSTTLEHWPGTAEAAGRRNIEGQRTYQDRSLGPRIDYPRPPPGGFETSGERYFTGGEVNAIPFRSPGEALEIVPGLVVGH
jgi:hypothetical protein